MHLLTDSQAEIIMGGADPGLQLPSINTVVVVPIQLNVAVLIGGKGFKPRLRQGNGFNFSLG